MRAGSRSARIALRVGVLTYLALIVLLPLAAGIKTLSDADRDTWHFVLTDPVFLAALRFTLMSATLAAALNVVFGLVLAWILIRYEFPGRRIIDALVDLPFAIPAVVAGIAYLSLYGPGGPVGKLFAEDGAFSPVLALLGVTDVNLTSSLFGVVMAQMFVTLPFVVRAMQPQIIELELDVEDAATSLGARPWQIFWRVIRPQIMPGVVVGFVLAFARAAGDFGMVTIVSGNIPQETLVLPVFVYQQIEMFDYPGAAVVSLVLMSITLPPFIGVFLWQEWRQRRAQR